MIGARSRFPQVTRVPVLASVARSDRPARVVRRSDRSIPVSAAAAVAALSPDRPVRAQARVGARVSRPGLIRAAMTDVQRGVMAPVRVAGRAIRVGHLPIQKAFVSAAVAAAPRVHQRAVPRPAASPSRSSAASVRGVLSQSPTPVSRLSLSARSGVPRCKDRPSSSRGSGGARSFVPWCR